MKLKGRIALVTGASRGIGRAIAQTLAAEGAAVGVNYRSGKEKAEEVVKAITAAGGRAVALSGDVAEFAQAKTLVEQTVKELGGLHILVNNAGIAKDGLIFNLEPEDWLSVMRVNFGGVFNCTKAAMGHFMAQREGVIVNVSSVMGERGWIGESNYASSKGAVNAFTRCSRGGAGALQRPGERRPARGSPRPSSLRGSYRRTAARGSRSRSRCGISERWRRSLGWWLSWPAPTPAT